MRTGPSTIAAVVLAVTVVAGVMVVSTGKTDDLPVSTDTTTETATSAVAPSATTIAEPVATTTTAVVEPTTTSTTSTTSTTIAGTAADDLAVFFARAAELDRALTAAADSINANMTENEMVVRQATVDLVQTTRGLVKDTEAAVPAGLGPDLLRATLPVFSDLVSRSYAMAAWERLPLPGYETIPLVETNVVSCLNHGSEAAARYSADMAALRELARSSPPVVDVAPDSRAAESVALHLANIEHGNRCCEGCGGFIVTELAEITYADDPQIDPQTGARTDGHINGIPFQADYAVGLGWTFEIFAG